MAINDPSLATKDEALKDPQAELENESEQINLDEASKVSGGVTSTNGS